MSPTQTASITQNVLAQEPVVMRRRKSWWLVLLPYVLWQVIALLLCELVLACAGIGEEEIFKFDKKLGFRHFPDKAVTWRSEGFSHSYFNSDGMRDPGDLTIAKPANTLRVALLGDSMTESLQVPFEQSWGRLVQEKIGPVDGKKVEVVNFGNSGYSTTQECLLLEEKVFKYQPDLVIVGYSSRDMMENWAPPDETLSNVRPAALKIPGRELIIDTTPVTNWLNSPRAKFLCSIDWFRHHSRVWGIISATELQLSMKEPIVKALLTFCTNPVHASRTALRTVTALLPKLKGVPKVTTVSPNDLVFKSGSAPIAASGATAVPGAVKPYAAAVAAPAAAVAVAAPAAAVAAPAAAVAVPAAAVAAPAADADAVVAAALRSRVTPSTVASVSDGRGRVVPKTIPVTQAASEKLAQAPGQSLSTQLMAATIEGLFGRMKNDCEHHHSKFMVIALPCRSDLSPYSGIAPLAGLTYEDELSIIRSACQNISVPFLDSNSPARTLPSDLKKSFFYGAHMAPPGHVYASRVMVPAVRSVLDAK
jgi:hypothetical protein